MKFIYQNLNCFVILLVLIAFISCHGQNQKTVNASTAPTQTLTIGDTVSSIGSQIDGILEDANKNYWFTTNGNGVYRYNGTTFIQLTEKHGLCCNYVFNVQQDAAGYLWFTTRDGICRFGNNAFINFTDTIKNAPRGDIKLKEGGLFFGWLDGVCYYDGNCFTNFAIHPDTYFPQQNNLFRAYSIYSYCIDKAGKVWFGTQTMGVCCFNTAAKVNEGENPFTWFTDKDLAGPAVRIVFADSQRNIWCGNNGGGLFCINKNGVTNITEQNKLTNYDFLKNSISKDMPGTLARVWAINEDNNGDIWIGTIDAGVWKYHNGKLTNYTKAHGLAGNSIWAIYKDTKGELWFVTNGEALCKLNPSAGKAGEKAFLQVTLGEL